LHHAGTAVSLFDMSNSVRTQAPSVDVVEKLMDLEQWHRASLELARVARANPETPGLPEAGVRLLLGQGRAAEAAQDAKRALGADPQNISLRFYLALAKERMGQVAESIEIWRELCRLQPDQAQLHACLADSMYWCAQPVFSADDTRLEVDRALAIDPNNPLALSVRFWQSSDAGDETAMRDTVSSIQRAHPGTAVASRLLARWYAHPRRRNLQEVHQLLRQFPTDQELRAIAAGLERRGNWMALLDPHLRSLLKAESTDPESLPSVGRFNAFLSRAVDTGSGFAERKLARALLEIEDAQHWDLIHAVVELAGSTLTDQVAFEPVLRWSLSRAPSSDIDADRLIRAAFRLNWSTLYRALLVDQHLSPSAESWREILPQILARPELLDEICERYSIYHSRPPLPIDLLVQMEPTTRQLKRRRSFHNAARQLLDEDPKRVSAVWAVITQWLLPAHGDTTGSAADRAELIQELVSLLVRQKGLSRVCLEPDFADGILVLFTQLASGRDPLHQGLDPWSAFFEAILYPEERFVSALLSLSPEPRANLITCLAEIIESCAADAHLWRRAYSSVRLLLALQLKAADLKPHRHIISQASEGAVEADLRSDLRHLLAETDEPKAPLADQPPAEPAPAESSATSTDRMAQAAAQFQARLAEVAAWYQLELVKIQSKGLAGAEFAQAMAALGADHAQRIAQAQADFSAAQQS
jgi:tetratricopeptide (TPR) repeat protein